jgi:hypothetical protein
MAQQIISNLQNLIKIPKAYWLQIGELVSGWVQKDARAGIMQDNTQGHQYSTEYAKRKATGMYRTTTGEGKTFSDKEGYFFGKTHFQNKKAKGQGERLKGYWKALPTSRDVSKVTMELTGLTLNGLHPKDETEISVTMAFPPASTKLLLGNKARGYDIIGLNTKNRDRVKAKIIQQLDENLRKQIGKKIVINIG